MSPALCTPRLRAAYAASAAVLAVGGLTPAAPASAAARTGSADLGVTAISDGITVGSPGKPFKLRLRNRGPATATGVVVTFDLSLLDTRRVAYQPPGKDDPACRAAATTVTCQFGDLDPGAVTEIGPSLRAVGDAGDAGGLAVTVRSRTSDPRPGDNTAVWVPVRVRPAGEDLVAVAFDVYADGSDPAAPRPVPAGRTATLSWFVLNAGDRSAHGLSYRLRLPGYVTFVRAPRGCRVTRDRRSASCRATGLVLRPGADHGFSGSARIRVSRKARPGALTGGFLRAGPVDAVPADNLAAYTVLVTGRPAQLPVTGVSVGPIAAAGLGLVLGGGLLVWLAARRRTRVS